MADITNRRFLVLGASLTAAQVNCLAHLSRGGLMATRLPDVPNPTLMAINWFEVEFSLWRHVSWDDGFAIADFQPEDMYSTLLMLANARGEAQCFVSGFMRASALFHTVQTGVKPNSETIFMADGESLRNQVWERPSSYNGLWGIVGIRAPAPNLGVPDGEYEALANGSVSTIFRMSGRGRPLLLGFWVVLFPLEL